MSSGISDWGATALADHFTGTTALPSTLYVALCFSEPDVGTDGTALDVIEPAGASYGRISLPRDSSHWAAGDQGMTATSVDVNWSAAGEDWGIITHYALCTAASAGNVLGWGIFADTQRIMTGDTMTIPAGGIAMSFVSLQPVMML